MKRRVCQTADDRNNSEIAPISPTSEFHFDAQTQITGVKTTVAASDS